MKLDRLLGILAILQQNKQVTAPYLAKKFEVSRRTIARDIDAICKAGIPVVTTQGSGGGISLMEGYALDTTLFTEQELAAIFTGLKTLDSVSKEPNAERLAEKIGGDAVIALPDHIRIDLSSFYKEELASDIALIKQAIEERRILAFHYYYNKGEADKQIEPYWIVFRWSSWYVFGFCRERQDFRLYKLRRMSHLTVTEIPYKERVIPEEKQRFGSHMTDDYAVTAIYDPSVKYRLVEEYGAASFFVQADGTLYTRWGFTSPEEAVLWFLGFGDKVTVIDPPEMVEKMRAVLLAIAKKYSEHDK